MFRRLASIVAVGAAATIVAFAASAPAALAHARYKSSTPGTGEAITASPTRVEITFTQEVQKIAGGYGIQVVKDRGLDVTAGPAVVDDTDRTKLSVPLQPSLAAGRYVVNWTNTSDADGDPASGAFSFYLNYQPNAVDLASDAQLAQIGAEDEETPAAGETPGTAATAEGTTGASPAATTAPVATVVASPAATSTPASTNDGGGSNTRVIVTIIVVAIAGAAIALGSYGYFGRKR